MRTLSKQSILDARDLETKQVAVKEWGGCVTVKQLSVAESDAFQRDRMAIPETEGESAVMRLLLSYTLVDDLGDRLFDSPDDLAKKSPKVIGRLFVVALRYNKMDTKSIEEIEGES